MTHVSLSFRESEDLVMTHLSLCFVSYLCWVWCVHRGHQWSCEEHRVWDFPYLPKAPCQDLFTHTRVPGWNLWAGTRQTCSLTNSLMNSPCDCRRICEDKGKAWLVISVLWVSWYEMQLFLRRAKVRRLIQYSPVSGTYIDHVSFLFILQDFPLLCVLNVVSNQNLVP